MDNLDGEYWKVKTEKRPRTNTSKFLSGLLFQKVPKNSDTTKPTSIEIKDNDNINNTVQTNIFDNKDLKFDEIANNDNNVNNTTTTTTATTATIKITTAPNTTETTTTTTTITTDKDIESSLKSKMFDENKENVIGQQQQQPQAQQQNTSAIDEIINTNDLKKSTKKKSRLESTLDGIYWYFDPTKPRKRNEPNNTTPTSNETKIKKENENEKEKREKGVKKEKEVKKEKLKEKDVKKEKKPSILESIKMKYNKKNKTSSSSTNNDNDNNSEQQIDDNNIKKEDERVKVSFVLSPTKENKEIRYEFVLLKEKLPKLNFNVKDEQNGNDDDDDGDSLPPTQEVKKDNIDNGENKIVNIKGYDDHDDNEGDDSDEETKKINRTRSLMGINVDDFGNHQHYFDSAKNEGFKVFEKLDSNINVFVGGKNCLSNLEWLEKKNIVAILNATIEVSLPKSLEHLKFFRVSVSDSIDQPINRYFNEAIEFIQSSLIKSPESSILIHCKEGRSRSTTLAVAFGMKALKLNLKDSYEHVKNSAPRININTGFQFQLMEYEKSLYGSNSLNFFGSRNLNRRALSFTK